MHTKRKLTVVLLSFAQIQEAEIPADSLIYDILNEESEGLEGATVRGDQIAIVLAAPEGSQTVKRNVWMSLVGDDVSTSAQAGKYIGAVNWGDRILAVWLEGQEEALIRAQHRRRA